MPSPRTVEPGNLVSAEPPSPEKAFRLETETGLTERMRREALQGPEPTAIAFPEEPVLSRGIYGGRRWEPLVEAIEPAYVCYGRLYFEQKNSERYGWSLGVFHPIISAAVFYLDVAILPYRLGTEPCRRCECSAGYCLPGDPVPLLLYPPELSISGAASQVGTMALLAAIFP